jgi:membrane protease YdiL (CAAX protease family)
MVEPDNRQSGCDDGGRARAIAAGDARLAAYFALTFAAAWTAWLAGSALATAAGAGPGTGARALFFLPGTFAPGIVALLVTARTEGGAGVRELASGVFEWRVGLRWYLVAIGYMAAAELTVAALHRVLAGAWPAFGAAPWYLMFAAIPLSTPVQAGEELGWRGYALPRLSERLGLPRASVILGIIWALWHLPLFHIAGTDTTGQSFAPYLMGVTALSVAMAWLWWRTRGSLLLVMLMHAAINNTAGLVRSAVPDATHPLAPADAPSAWLTATVLWVAAAYFLTRMRGAAVDRLPPVVTTDP